MKKKGDSVLEYMSRPLRTLPLEANVRDAARFLGRWRIGGAPVVDERGRPVGVFSLADLAARLWLFPGRERPEAVLRSMRGTALEDLAVADLMTREIVCVDPEAPLAEAARMMEGRCLHRLFVRRGRGPLLGVLTTMDLLRWVRRGLRGMRTARARRGAG